MAKKGLFITLEGTDGVGKTTQSHLLADWLNKMGHTVIETREPGGGAAARVAEQIREILLDPMGQMAPLTELMLYEAARAEHVDKVIRPALAAGKSVVCDRYTDSTMAYQGAARGLNRTTIEQLNRIATSGLKPTLTLLLDLPSEQALKKALDRSGHGDRLENEGFEFHQKVRKGFLAAAKLEPKRIKVIQVKPSIDQTRKDIQAAVRKALKWN